MAYLAMLGCIAYPQGATSNDSLALMGVGGLVLSKTEDVAMVREDLDVSVERITVRYVFRNRSDKDVSATVAFPLPSVPAGLTENSPVRLDDSNANFVGFTVKVDGKPVETALQEKAFKDGKDITAKVRRYGLSPNVMAKGWRDAPGVDLAGARKAELLDDNDGAWWDFQPTFYWSQSFPAGKDIVVEHAYGPVAGSGIADRKEYCIDEGTEAAIQRMWAGDKDAGEHYNSHQVEYVLMSAKTWSGPIGEFHLTIRKDRPDTVVSTCMEGLVKTGPTTFEMTARDFVPKRDLGVLFVNSPASRKQDK